MLEDEEYDYGEVWGTWECPVCGEEHEDPELTQTHCRKCELVVDLSYADYNGQITAYKSKFQFKQQDHFDHFIAERFDE